MTPSNLSVRRLATLSPLFIVLTGLGCSEYEIASFDDANVGLGDTAVPVLTDEVGDPPTGTNLEQGDIWGRICDTSGEEWVVGAYVYVPIDDDGDGVEDWRAEATTDADGYFRLSGVPAGAHTVFVEKGSFSVTFEVELGTEGIELAEAECLDTSNIDVAVVSGEYDTIEDVISGMGLEYDLYQGRGGQAYIDFLTDAEQLANYDIVFLNCGIADNWIPRRDEIGEALSIYVAAGGSVYASDWAYYFFEAAFPGSAEFYGNDERYGAAYMGVEGVIDAQVVDPNMVNVLGSEQARINYDLGSWAVIESVADETEVLILGDVAVYEGMGMGDAKGVPLAIGIEEGDGRMVYTTFHNERQMTLDMEKLLTEIVLSL